MLSRRWLPGLLMVLFVIVLPADPLAWAGGDDGSFAGWGDDGVQTGAWSQTPDGHFFGNLPVAGPDDPYMYRHAPACAGSSKLEVRGCIEGREACTEGKDGQLVDWFRSLKPPSPTEWIVIAGSTCIYSEKPRDILAEIAAVIGHEFQQSPVTPASLGSQPGPHTLRGQETNFYANASEQEFNITLLGQKVHITATPVGYTWNYGDGTIMGPTASAGAPLPEDRIGEQTKTSHVYTTTGKFSINLTTHFNGTYSVNGGPALPITDQGHFASAPLGLTVWRAETRNYADDCNANPAGVGC